MAEIEFDSTLGGSERLPFSANSLKFAASRSIEIAAMTESILRPSKTKLIFQTLPVHMRRRVMSHNSKRLPKKLRDGHLEQLKKSGLPPKQKRPSRKYRRRPKNLMEEYNRRQRKHVWLETHIWHAKRFHMTDRWGYRLPYAPCDKAFRACYRATSAHCLLQDISYYTPFQIVGKIEDIRDVFSKISNSSCGLGICAKAFLSGTREGFIHLYKPNLFPYGYIGKIQFIWVQNDNNVEKRLWLFVHPSHASVLESIITSQLFCNETINENAKRRKIANYNIQFKTLPGVNRLCLTGPNSHAVLVNSLKCIQNLDQLNNVKWVSLLDKTQPLYLEEKCEFWQSIASTSSPSQLPPRMVIGLIVRDPRLSRPNKRTKARKTDSGQVPANSILNFPPSISTSPLWETKLHDSIKEKQLTNGQFIEHVTKTQLVPGELFEEDPALQSIPVVLIQRPGSQDSKYKKLGYGSGWDLLIPPGYGTQFWLTLIMFGARAGGLRETESLAFEMGECFLPPDSDAGHEEEARKACELKERYFKLPPSKRVNYIKIAIHSPFICPWKTLLKDWGNQTVNEFFVLRNKIILHELQNCLEKKMNIPKSENAHLCLVAVYLQLTGKGKLKNNALICIPEIDDGKTLFEPHHKDPNEKTRKEKRKEHFKYLKTLRKKRIALKKNGKSEKKLLSNGNKEPSEYVKMMRDLWLPPKIETIREVSCRQTIGFISQGAFSFSEAKCCGIGYVAYNGLSALLSTGQNHVLVRNISSRKYQLANIQIIKD